MSIILSKKDWSTVSVLKPVIKGDGRICSPDGAVRKLNNLGLEAIIYKCRD